MSSPLTGVFYALLMVVSMLPLSVWEVAAQTAEQQRITAVREAYRRLEFERADSLARRALDDRHRFSPSQLVELHLVVANIAYARNDEETARRHFGLALQLRPDLVLDPSQFSPKIIEFLDLVREEELARESLPPIVYQVIELDSRPAAALRSALFPGWGQFYKGEDAKGWTMAGVWTGSTLAAVHSRRRISHLRADLSRDPDPRQRTDLEEAEDRWIRVRNYTTIISAAAWVASYVDALLHVPTTSVGFHLAPQPDGGTVSLRVNL
jgi:hypothetical protein